MNAIACYVFLLAIGLSAQMSEFEIDFQHMVNTRKLANNKSLLDCPENCTEIKEPACKCVDTECLNSPVHPCLKDGLNKLGFRFQETRKVLKRIQHLNERLENLTWQKPSPKHILNYIQKIFERSNAQQSN